MRDYYDDSLFYCLDDGSSLLDGPATFDTAKTEVMRHAMRIGEEATVVYQPPSSSDLRRLNSVAVLPFANLSGASDNEYFSDGLSEELLNVLSKISGLRVAARTSAGRISPWRCQSMHPWTAHARMPACESASLRGTDLSCF